MLLVLPCEAFIPDADPNAVAAQLTISTIAPVHSFARGKKILALSLSLALLACSTEPLLLAQAASPTPQTSAPEPNATAFSAPPLSASGKTIQPPRPATGRQKNKARKLYSKGTSAMQKGDTARALALLAQAHHLVPDNAEYLAEYEIAKQQRISDLLQTSEKQQAKGSHSDALTSLQQAQSLDPQSPFVHEHLQALSAEALRAAEPATAQLAPMPTLATGIIPLEPTLATPDFHFRANEHDLIHRIYEAYGMTVLLDESVPDNSLRIDLDHADFATAAIAIQKSTHTFQVALDPHRVLLAADTIQNRKQFDRMLFETIYLPGLNTEQIQGAVSLIKNIFGVQQIGSLNENSTISIRSTEPVLRAINLTMASLYKSKPEVLLDIHLYEVTYTHTLDLGPQLPQQFTAFNVYTQIQSLITANQSLINQLIASGLVNQGDYAAIAALLVYYGLAGSSILAQPFALFGGGLTLSGISFSGATFNSSLNTSTVKQLEHMQLRASDQQKAKFLVGERYPIISQSYSGSPAGPSIPGLAGAAGLGGFAGLGTNSSNTGATALAYAPQVQYEDLGLTLQATPIIHRDRQVNMKLEIKIEALGSGSENGIPVLDNRSFESDVEVHDGDSALLVSSITRQESNSISGIPGLSELPLMSWTATINKQETIGDLLLVVTPHIVNAASESVSSAMFPVPPEVH